MRCRRCGFEMHDDWAFCPRCGARRGSSAMDSFGRDLFSQIFGRMKDSFRDFEEVDKMFEKDIEALDLSPWFKKIDDRDKVFSPVKGRGFSVRITRSTGKPPRVSIKTYGDVDRSKLEEEVESRFGTPEKQAEGPVPERHEESKRRIKFPSLTKKTVPKVTEEPEAEVRRIGDKVVVDISMPDVKSSEDVEVKELESSVEVKAITGDKAYFKILTKPARFRLSGMSFQKGNLHLEFS